MSIFNSSPRSDDEKWSLILHREEILGECRACGRKNTYALLTIYGDGEVLMRCKACKKPNQFIPNSEEDYNNALRWRPQSGWENEETSPVENKRIWERGDKRGKRRK